MTNEEKAQTLVDGLGIIYTDCNRVTIKKLLMEMAKWKDEQHLKDNHDPCMDFEHEAQSFMEDSKKGE